MIGYCLEGFAAVAARKGDHRRAARLLGTAHELLIASGGALEPAEEKQHQQTVAAVESALGSETMNELWAEGRKTPLEAAIELGA